MTPLLLLALAALAADDSRSEAPTGQWRIDYGDAQCVAIRPYGNRELAFRSAPNGQAYEIVLIEPGATAGYATQSEGSVSFGGEPVRTTVLVYSDRKAKKRFFKYRLAANEIEAGKTASQIVLRSRRTDPSVPQGDTRIITMTAAGSADFALSSMAEVIDQMEKCVVDLRKHWNDAGHSSVVAVPPKGNIAGLFNGDDYPSDALSRDQGGTTQAILLIDEKGKVAGCFNAMPSGIASVDAMSCQVIVSRARFEPARDASGRTVRSIYYSPRITFRVAG